MSIEAEMNNIDGIYCWVKMLPATNCNKTKLFIHENLGNSTEICPSRQS